MDECKLASVSHPPVGRVVDSTSLTDSNSQSESFPDLMKCLSSASWRGDRKAKSVIESTDYTGVEPKARPNRNDYIEERTEWKTEYGMTKEEKDRIFNIKEEVEEEEGGKEWQSVKMEEGDGVRVEKGHGRKQEEMRDEQEGKDVTDLTCQTHKCEKLGVNSEYGEQEGEELSTPVIACLLKRPRVLICRLKTTDISVPVSQPPCPLASKDQGVRSYGRRHEVSALKEKSLRQRGQVMTWKREMIGQLERPHKQLPASLENGIGVEATHNPPVISSRNQNTAAVAFIDECKLASLSQPPVRGVVDSTKLTNSNTQSASLPDSMKCLSHASNSGGVKAESVMESTDYMGVEPKVRSNTSDDLEERTKWKTEYGMTKEEKDRLCNMKEGKKEESTEWQSVKMGVGDGVRVEKGLGREPEKVRDEQEGKGETDLTCQTRKFENNGGKSKYGQKEGEELSTLVTACLLKQPRVLVCKLKAAAISVSVSQAPCPMASKDQGVRSHRRRHEVSALKGKCSLRQKGQVMTWKQEMIGQLGRPQRKLPASSENEIGFKNTHNSPIMSPRKANTGQTVGESSQVLACSQCPFVHTKEVNLHQHMEQVHAEEFSRYLVSGGSGGQNPSNSAIAHHPEPPKTLPTPTGSHTGSSGAHKLSQCRKNFKSKSQLTGHQRTYSGGYTYHCSQCGKNYKSKGELKIHHRVHTGERPYHCSQCGKSFIRSTYLTRHQRIHSGERPYHCSQCGKSFIRLGRLITHRTTHTGDRPYQCSQCGKNYTTKRELIVHHRVHTGERPYHCSQCGKNFKSKGELIVHHRVHTGERPYHCSQCGKSFLRSAHLISHQRIHTGERPYHCSQCGKKFKSKGELTGHNRVHTGERPFHCSQCGKKFKSKGELTVHQRVHSEKRPYQCSHCGKSFIQSAHLITHQRTHSGERPYYCSQCGKNFKSKGELAAHHRIHTGERPCQCFQCGKSFLRLGHLIRHQRIHTGERPYQCSQCGKNFKSKGDLAVHHRIHTGERPHQCSQCGKNFKMKGELTVHHRVHTGERPYHCSQCGKSYKSKKALTAHQQTHTGERLYHCTECEKRFTLLHHLQRHQRAHTKSHPYQ